MRQMIHDLIMCSRSAMLRCIQDLTSLEGLVILKDNLIQHLVKNSLSRFGLPSNKDSDAIL